MGTGLGSAFRSLLAGKEETMTLIVLGAIVYLGLMFLVLAFLAGAQRCSRAMDHIPATYQRPQAQRASNSRQLNLPIEVPIQHRELREA